MYSWFYYAQAQHSHFLTVNSISTTIGLIYNILAKAHARGNNAGEFYAEKLITIARYI